MVVEKRGGGERLELKGSKTEANLKAAFAGESQARNKYTFYAGAAKKEGLEQVAGIFLETADDEKEHAKRAFKFLAGVGTSAQNLQAAIEGENFEWSKMYKEFAATARTEGFAEIAEFFEEVGEVEEEHEKRFQALLERVQSGTMFERPTEIKWHCRNCGYIHTGKTAPQVCPACAHPQAFYEPYCENF